jgi:putative ABC transport system ATP-binding protein
MSRMSTVGQAAESAHLLSVAWPGGVSDRCARAFRREHVGFVFQQHSLIPFLTELENVALVMQLNGIGTRESARRAHELPDYLEIGHRALANQPSLILADEPTAALDTGRGNKVMALLRRFARERGSAVITVTHDHRTIAGFDTVYHLEDGVLVDVQRHGAEAAAGAA